jgi:hypothetical protein
MAVEAAVQAPLDAAVQAPLDAAVEAPLDAELQALLEKLQAPIPPLDTLPLQPLYAAVQAPLEATPEEPKDAMEDAFSKCIASLEAGSDAVHDMCNMMQEEIQLGKPTLAGKIIKKPKLMAKPTVPKAMPRTKASSSSSSVADAYPAWYKPLGDDSLKKFEEIEAAKARDPRHEDGDTVVVLEQDMGEAIDEVAAQYEEDIQVEDGGSLQAPKPVGRVKRKLDVTDGGAADAAAAAEEEEEKSPWEIHDLPKQSQADDWMPSVQPLAPWRYGSEEWHMRKAFFESIGLTEERRAGQKAKSNPPLFELRTGRPVLDSEVNALLAGAGLRWREGC